MSNKNEIRNELEGLSPRLAALKGKQVITSEKVDDSYFDELQLLVESQLFDQEDVKAENKKRSIRLWIYSSIAVAASITLFFLTRNSQQIQFPEFEVNSQELLVMEEIDAFEMEYLIELDPYTDEIEAEELLLEENNLEELLNI